MVSPWQQAKLSLLLHYLTDRFAKEYAEAAQRQIGAETGLMGKEPLEA